MRTRIFWNLSVTIAMLVLQATAVGQVHIADIMSQTEFRQAGLSKLTPEELSRLDRWLVSYSVELLEAAQAKSPVSSGDVIESNIEGDFEGWDGETIFQLENGQIWQQASYNYHYHYSYRPEVIIYRTNVGYVMKVEGVDETIRVVRLK